MNFNPNPAENFLQYYASNDALIMIGDIFVDQAVSIAYSYRRSSIPIYSYNKDTYSKVAKGKKLVQGSLVVNYVSDDYISTILEEAGNKLQEKKGLISFEKILNFKEQRLQELAKAKPPSGLLYSMNSSTKTAADLAKQIAGNPRMRRELLDDLKRREQARIKAIQNGLEGKPFNSDVSSRTTTVSHLLGITPVNILVTHGNINDPNNPVYRIIKEVTFLGVEHQTAPVGAVQTETYSFMAKEVI